MDEFVNKNVVIRTVGYHYMGRVSGVGEGWITLEDASWLADSGRWSAFLRDGVAASSQTVEIEPYLEGPVLINRQAVLDVCEWKHELPREAV